MTAPGGWSSDNPFVTQGAQEPTDQWSPDNPFVEQTATVAAEPLAAPEPEKKVQSDFLTGFVGSVGGAVPKSFGNFLKTVGLEELGEPLVEMGQKGEAKAVELYGQPKAPSWRDVNSIGEALDFAQYQLGSGLGTTVPSLAAGGAAVAAGAGTVPAAIGALAMSYMQNTGSIKEELDQLGEEDRKGLALTLGVPVALLDAVTPVDLINRIVAKQVAKAASRGLIKQGLRSATGEAVTEAAQESIQYAGTREGTDKPINLAEMAERGIEAGVAGGLTGGALGAAAGVIGAKPTPQSQRRAADPTTLKPRPDPTKEPSADEKAKFQSEIDKLKAQEQSNLEAKSASDKATRRTINTWTTLKSEQRKTVFPGLASSQYDLAWKDLTLESQAAIRKELGTDSYTNLNTSPTSPSAPPAQGAVPPTALSDEEVAELSRLQTGSAPSPRTDRPAIRDQRNLTEQIPEERRAGPRGDVAQMSMEQLEEERKRAGSKLTMLAIDAEGGPAAAKGNELEREHWQQYMNDLEAERAKRLAPGGDKQRASIENITAEDTDVVGSIEPTAGQEHVGKRFKHPTRPDLVAVISRNTKKGEKPWRVTYFKQSEKGMEDYLHNHFDTPQEAYDWLTSKPDMEGDKLKGYIDETPIEMPGSWQQALKETIEEGPMRVDDREAIDELTRPDRGPDEGTSPALPSEGPSPTAPTAPQSTTPEGAPEAGGPAGPIQPGDAEAIDKSDLSNKGKDILRRVVEPDNLKAIDNDLARLEELTKGLREPTERPIEDRLPDIEQSIEDKTQVEKLLGGIDKQGDLDNIYREKLLSASLDELDDMIDNVERSFEEGKITEADFRNVLNDISDAKRAIKAREAPPPPVPLKFKQADTTGKPLSSFKQEQLDNTKKYLGSIAKQFGKGTPEYDAAMVELNRIWDFEADKRRKNPLGDESGFFQYNPAHWRLPRGVRRKAVKTSDRSSLPHYEQTIAERVGLEEDPVNPYTVSDLFRKAYAGIFNKGFHIKGAEALSGKKLQAHESPFILSQMTNRFLTQAEEYMRGQGPFVPDADGNYVATGTPALNVISAEVGDDVERLGWLALARRELYERANNQRSIGLDPVASELMWLNTPAAYHTAADHLAQYNHDLAGYAQWGGLIDAETFAKFTSMFYAPIRRIFGTEIEGAVGTEVTPRGKNKRGVGGENPIKKYKGSKDRIVNPYETSAELTPRIIRAANQNHTAALLVGLAKENLTAYKGVLEPASARMANKIKADIKARAAEAKAEAADAGIELTLAEAERFIGTMGDEALAIRDNVLNVWVDGKLEHWVMHPDLAYSLKALQPQELAMLWRALAVPADVQRQLIVNDPTFIMFMSMVDTFQAFVNSRYGFVPVVDSFKGWWNAVNVTPEFQNYRRGGGGLSSLTSKNYGKSRTSLHDIVGAPESQKPLSQAIHQLKTFHPIEAWRTVVAPVAEAARVGEYLNARGRGASVIEAVYAAKSITGNYSLQGGGMQALNRMALFLNPALQVLDTTRQVIQRNPISWFLKSSVIGGAAMMLYVANADDDDIRELRQTEGGQRYFFFRLPNGSIGKIRKPFLEGAIFAGGIEAAMDKARGENPEAFNLWLDAITQELKVNFLPAAGVIPLQVYTNKDWRTGAPIRPENNEMLEPMYQARAMTGTTARVIGKETNTSPALIEWIARSQFGLLGSHVMAAIEASIEWKQTGQWTIPEELPFVNRVLARYPSTNTASIRSFYEKAEKAERVYETVEYMTMNDPEALELYVEEHQKELAIADMFKDTREQLADYRQAIEDLYVAGPDVVSPSDRRQITDEFLRIMIETARQAVLTDQAITEAMTAPSVPQTTAPAK